MQSVTITPDANHSSVDRLRGFSIRETASADAIVELRKATVGGERVAVIAIAPDDSANMEYRKPGISMEAGTYVKVVLGSIEGEIYQN